ncbi:unnamed protein product [Ostreobium quekettii]|uniref:monoamine oxidase n=1 Tax=Ostreobium quekettii TaxID=121088 RepID=A0A8S1JBG4_9CHLO|nr:unnamed protein product [Ostreobium quekettii]|eukprot:evm.model.scf_2701EXC.3 EVM.evm.TU.scf_2701EXC.3   scf_2701EXC:17287-18546(+)
MEDAKVRGGRYEARLVFGKARMCPHRAFTCPTLLGSPPPPPRGAAGMARPLGTSVLIGGGGLSGLSLALHLKRAGIPFLLVEARDRLGGRILSPSLRYGAEAAAFDAGPAWYWPGQPRMVSLVRSLGLTPFEQHSAGASVHEDERGRVSRDAWSGSMAGSLRLDGGFGALVEAMVGELPQEAILLSHRLTKLCREEGNPSSRVVAQVSSMGGDVRIMAECAVLAMPPRVVAQAVDFAGGLPESALGAMGAVPTWMAGQAKLIATFDRPFWREAGLSGDGISRRGPLAEIHDASPRSGGPYALFGFVATPPDGRRDADALKADAKAQLVRMYGPGANAPLEIVVKDWAFEEETATAGDWGRGRGHPAYGLPRALKGLWDGRLLMGSTEVAWESGGFLEGALEAAEAVMDQLPDEVRRCAA